MEFLYILTTFIIFISYNLIVIYSFKLEFPLRPYNILFVLIFIYSLSVPFYFNVHGSTYYGEEYSESNYFSYYLTCLGSLFSLTITDIIFIKKYKILSSIKYSPLILSSYTTLTLVILFLFFFLIKISSFNIFNVISYSENALLPRELARTNKFSGIEDIFFEQIPFFFIFTTTFLLIWKKGFVRFVWILIAFYIIAIAFLSGSRGYILQVILPFVIFIFYRNKNFKSFYIFIFFLIGIAFSNFIEVFRSISVFEVKDLFDLFTENSFNLKYIIASSGELAVSVNLLKLIKEIDISSELFQYGLSFLEQLSTFVPNAFLPFRPLIASEKFVYLFYNNVYNIGGGYGFFILQDGYWDFGILGSMFSMSFFLVLLNFIFLFLYKKFKEGSVIHFFLFVLFIKNLVIFSVRSGIIASLKALWIDLIPLFVFFILIYFLNLLFWKKSLK